MLPLFPTSVAFSFSRSKAPIACNLLVIFSKREQGKIDYYNKLTFTFC